MRRAGFREIIVAVLALGGWSTIAGCGSEATSSPELPSFEDVAPETDGAAADAPRLPIDVTEEFRAAFGYQGRIALSDQGKQDLRIADPRDTDPANDLSLASPALAMLNPALDCNLGCFVDSKLHWIAVATSASSGASFVVQVGKIAADLSITMLPLAPIDDVRYLRFGNDTLFWSSLQAGCAADSGPPAPCFRISSVDLANGGAPTPLFSFPGSDALSGSMFGGHFTVGEDGVSLVLLNPTNVSQTVYVWRDGKPAKATDAICAAPDPEGIPGKCGTTGTSSQFSDRDPAALSADGKHLAYALVEGDAELRLHHDNLETGARNYSVLLGVPSGYSTNACYNRADWQYKAVRAPLRFSRDGKEILFVGSSDCAENSEKPWTNLVGVALDRIGSGAKLQAGDLRRVTDNPHGKIAKCITITDFDLSPTGEYALFVGTPILESDGKTEIKDTDQRSLNGAEVYVTRTDGTSQPLQITNSLTWMATGVTAVP